MSDWKAEYLAKTFSRTNHKKWENYIITGIWHRLHDLSLQPVTQQYVKRETGYALLDLYFPQLNFAVEVDEFYHDSEEQIKKDKEREEQVKKSLESIFVKNDDELEIRRVKITADSDINAIDKKIDEIVQEINQLKNEAIYTWSETPADFISEKGYLFIEDFVYFKTIEEIATAFGEKSRERHCRFPSKNKNLEFWCPKLQLDNPQKDKNSWKNTLSLDGKKIIEEDKEERNIKLDVDGIRRAVFAKSKNSVGIDAYRFLGIYEQDKNPTGNTRTYTRVATEIKLQK